MVTLFPGHCCHHLPTQASENAVRPEEDRRDVSKGDGIPSAGLPFPANLLPPSPSALRDARPSLAPQDERRSIRPSFSPVLNWLAGNPA